MSEKANPSINRNISAFKTAGAIALGGSSVRGWISRSASPSQISVQDSDIDDTQLNEFAETSSTTSFDVTIDAGEAFVYGSWLAIDVSTTVTLASSTNNQTVYVGWNKDGSDDVIVGLSSAFDSATGNTDQKIPLFDFDTDTGGVTAATDRRTIGKSIDLDDMDMGFDAGNDDLRWRDNTNETDRMALDRTTGNLTIEGALTEGAAL